MLPYTGTEFCGLPRMGVESFAVSQGSGLGWRRKSVNQEQALRDVMSTTASAAVRMTARASPSLRSGRQISCLALIADLQCAVLAEHLGRFACAFRTRGNPNAEVAVAEARIVAHRHGEP